MKRIKSKPAVVKNFLCAAGLALAACTVTAGASAVSSHDGRVTFGLDGSRPRAGVPFTATAEVSSALGAGFAFTLRVSVPAGVDFLRARSDLATATCSRARLSIVCRGRFPGGTPQRIGLVLRAASPGAYAFRATLVVEDHTELNPANNSARLAVSVARASARIGTAGADVVRGTLADDRLYGARGNDALYGFAGDDLLDGGPGDDRLFGGPGDDTLAGGIGENQLLAQAGDDAVRSLNGRVDTVDCGPGRDTVTADRSDRLLGCERVRLPS